MTLYSSFIDYLIVLLFEGLVLILFTYSNFITKKKIRQLVNTIGGGGLFIFLIFGIYFGLKDFLILYPLFTMINLLIKLVLEKEDKKHIWLTLFSFIFIIFSVITRLEVLFILALSLSIILFFSSTAITYYETRKSIRKQEKLNVFSLFSSLIFSSLVVIPIFMLLLREEDTQLEVLNITKNAQNIGIEVNSAIVFLLFLLFIVFLMTYELLENRGENEWYL